MKACVIQLPYSFDIKDADNCFNELINQLDGCDESLDIIVLPEYCDVPVATSDKTEFDACVIKYNKTVLEKAAETARRCNAVVFANAAFETEAGYRNTTYAIDREGKTVGTYFKAHPAPSEFKGEKDGGNGLDCGYSYEINEPYTVEIDGIRYGFMTCYDFYFYESFAPLARKNIDIIIGASHQRTDTRQALDIINRFLCYNTNAYLLRASVSLGEDSEVGGCSCIIAPDGTVLENMYNRVGKAVAEIDPKHKYYKPAGFRGKQKAHYEYIEEGRHPQNYRQCGSSVVLNDREMPYPRLCAHRGFSAVAPENTMPAFGAAVASGAHEIEFDLWMTKDKKLVSCHDSSLDRVSDGSGKIYDYTYDELLAFDFGKKFSERFAGLRICLFEEILQKLGARVIMNIHVKNPDCPESGCENRELIEAIVKLVKKYDCEKHVYFMSSSDDFLKLSGEIAPEIVRCVGEQNFNFDIVDRAIALGCEKVQLCKPYFNQEMIDLARSHGIICNMFYSDDADESQKFLDMGIDTILTNNFQIVKNVFVERDIFR